MCEWVCYQEIVTVYDACVICPGVVVAVYKQTKKLCGLNP
jgi:hypothetical protein